MSQPRLIAVGDNCLDVYVTRNILAVGGNALNVAAHWRHLGAHGRYFGAVGQDEEADIILKAVARAGLDAGDVEIIEGATALSLIVHEGGERRFLLESLGVGENYFPGESHYQDLTCCDFVHLGTHPNLQLLQRLGQDRVPFSIDLSNHAFHHLDLSASELVFASGGEVQSISSLIEKIKQRGGKKILITCGAEGAHYHEGGQSFYSPARNIDVIDSCGAGDSFLACFVLSRFFKGLDVPAALDAATSHAAKTCTHQGGFIQPVLPIPGWLYNKYAHSIVSAG